jgi:hypothetical protein
VKLNTLSLGVSGLLLAACAFDPAGETTATNSEEIVRGKLDRKHPQVVAVHVQGFGGRTLCSGTYISERVVITAAHCMRNDAIPGQTFVYHGDDYLADVASLPDIPAPGVASDWARAETSTVHPEYDRTVNYPDLAILHLDRELPFAPIRLYRRHVSKHEKHGEIVGWGGSKALTADISQVEGSGIKRHAKVRLLGSPTAADFHPDDPNPGILDPAIREDLIKTDGRAPRANGCAGDSGGPLLIEHHGREYLAGVGFWTGLFCEDYSMFVRIDPFLDFIDEQIERAGDAPIVPRLECVEETADGLRAHYGYQNDNGLTVEIPYGFRNRFPADDEGARPSAFGPGNHAYEFSVDFAADESLAWRLWPRSGPLTTVTANASSVRCDPESVELLCANSCTASLTAECADPVVTRGQCMNDCALNASFFNDFGCGAEWNAFLACSATVPPAEENWDCSFPGFPPSPMPPNCDAELMEAFICAGF